MANKYPKVNQVAMRDDLYLDCNSPYSATISRQTADFASIGGLPPQYRSRHSASWHGRMPRIQN